MPKENEKRSKHPALRGRVGSASQINAKIKAHALDEARRDPQVGAFLRDARARGEQLHREGLIHP